MTAPRPLSKCQRCGDSYRDHVHHGGADACTGFLPRERPASKRKSFSFNPAEVRALAEMLEAVAKRDTRGALAVADVRGPALESVLGRVRRARG